MLRLNEGPSSSLAARGAAFQCPGAFNSDTAFRSPQSYTSSARRSQRHQPWMPQMSMAEGVTASSLSSCSQHSAARQRIVCMCSRGTSVQPVHATPTSSSCSSAANWAPHQRTICPQHRQQQQQQRQQAHGWHAPLPCCCPQPQQLPRHASGRRLHQPLPPTAAAAAVLAAPLQSVPPEAAAAAATAAAVAASSWSWSQCLAVGLGYAVMVGSLFRSVPQIIKILRARSVEGLSLMSNVVELCCYSIVIAYNFSQGYPFNTFGEVCACWAQDVVLVALFFHYTRTPWWATLASTAAFAAGCWLLLSPWFPGHVLAALQACTILIMALGSRLPQILLNMRRGNSGVLSVTTCLLNVAGNAARTFTTLVLTGDTLLLGGIMTQGCMNSVLLWQSLRTAYQRGELWAGRGRRWGRPAVAASAAATPGPPGSSSPFTPRPAT